MMEKQVSFLTLLKNEEKAVQEYNDAILLFEEENENYKDHLSCHTNSINIATKMHAENAEKIEKQFQRASQHLRNERRHIIGYLRGL